LLPSRVSLALFPTPTTQRRMLGLRPVLGGGAPAEAEERGQPVSRDRLLFEMNVDWERSSGMKLRGCGVMHDILLRQGNENLGRFTIAPIRVGGCRGGLGGLWGLPPAARP
jgi:hypothetical protein